MKINLTDILEIDKEGEIKISTKKIKNLNPDAYQILLEDSLRGTGRSTRLIDKYIQELFTNGKVTIEDHYPGYNASNYLLDRVLKRLELEHRRAFDVKGLIITLK